MTTSKKLHLGMLYLVLAFHCLFGGLFAFCFNYLFLLLDFEPVGAFVCGVAGAIGSFLITFFTIFNVKKKEPK